jgi:hypothetical protein
MQVALFINITVRAELHVIDYEKGVFLMNCWEFKECGREKGGAREQELGLCPAYPEYGKSCARVAGTFCGGEVQGTFATKLPNCMQCDYYKSGHYEKAK